MDTNVHSIGGGQNYNHKTLKRESNLELLRIVAMITIVAHHYVVNSGITNEFDYSSITSVSYTHLTLPTIGG